MAPGKFSLHSSCEGEHGIALESWQGNQASRGLEGVISRSFSSCGRKPWVPSTCDGDLREHLRVPMGSQEDCGVGEGNRDCSLGPAAKEGPHLSMTGNLVVFLELQHDVWGFS